MVASAIEICLRKKGKANRPSELEKKLLGYYIRLEPGSQGVMHMSPDKTVAAW